MTTRDWEHLRNRTVEVHLAARGITDPKVLEAFRGVSREAFVPGELAEFAYEDAPLPIGHGQTISQPYIVAFMAQALALEGRERILEVGTGSGYAAAILGRLAKEVYSVERAHELADTAKERLARLGFDNVEVTYGDGSLGWPQHAPYDAIAIAAGGPKAPPALLAQLAIGGRLVIPIGEDMSSQVLTRITRDGEAECRHEALADVRFVPLVGEQAWDEFLVEPARERRAAASLHKLVREAAEPIDDVDGAAMDALLDRIGDARLVLLGESSHGTSEFYRMHARISRELIARRGFQFVAVEADWPDASRVDDYVLGGPRRSSLKFTPFARFPTWMWRNEEFHDFVGWLRAFNADHPERPLRPGAAQGARTHANIASA